MRKYVLVLVALLLNAATLKAEVSLPQIFQSGMVLQRGTKVPVWGKANPQEEIVVRINKQELKTVADEAGNWRVDLAAMKAGGPYELRVNDLVFSDVWMGDVWLCSGQSNMETTVERVYPQYPEEIDADENAQVRLFHVPNVANAHGEQTDIPATKWQKLSKTSAWRFSAIGYFLGKHLQKEKGVAQGIIESAWGGTPIEAWISADTIARHYPVYYRQTQLFTNDEFIAAQRKANQLADDSWQRVLNENDPGMARTAGNGFAWTQPALDESAWTTIGQYDLAGAFKGKHEYVGTVWLRQHIHIDKEHAGKKAQLLLGTLFDCDYTYINGQEVGRTYYQYPPRRYEVPEGLLREGDNVIAVRFVNKYGIPHFIKEKPYRLVFGKDDQQALSEQWLLRMGVEMPKAQGAGLDLHNQPSTLYNGMISPLAPLAVSGVLWYQGETNTGKAYEYAPMLRLLMANWRQAFGRPELPFVIIQLANYMEPSAQPQNTGWSQLREAQRVVAREDSRAELTVTIDLGETVDIHPLRKKEVAQRVATCLDKLVYQNKRVVLSPEVVGCEVADGRIVLTMDQEMQDTDEARFFEVAGADGRFVNTTASVHGRQITVVSPLATPSKLRYAWRNNPLGVNVYGKAGLPLSPLQMDVK